MIKLKEINTSIARACNMIDECLNVGYESEPFIRAHVDDLTFVLDYVVDELGRHQKKEMSEGSIEESIGQAIVKNQALVPLKNIERALKRAISLPEEKRKKTLLELSEMSMEYKGKAEGYLASRVGKPASSTFSKGFVGPESVIKSKHEKQRKKKGPIS